MRLLFDTSTLIASLVEEHTAYAVTYPWLQAVIEGKETGLLSTHSLAEAYAKLTRIPFASGTLPVRQVESMLLETIVQSFTIIPLTEDDYKAVIAHLAGSEQTGGIIYDALILRAGVKAKADRILTLNARHFQRIDPNLADRIFDPSAQRS